MENQDLQLKRMVYAALMAALTAVGAYIAIPIGPVPIVLQNLFVMLTGLLLAVGGGDQHRRLSGGRCRGAAGIRRGHRWCGKICGTCGRIPSGICPCRLPDRHDFRKGPGAGDRRCAGHGRRLPPLSMLSGCHGSR